jgi:hypothetical protein
MTVNLHAITLEPGTPTAPKANMGTEIIVATNTNRLS